MMENVFYTCFAVSAAAAGIKIIISAACRERASKAFQLIIDAVLLIVILFSFLGISLPEVTDFEVAETMDFERIEADMYAEVIKEAEDLLTERIKNAVEEHFAVIPSDCLAKIDGEKMVLEELCVYFDFREGLISAYDVKAFLKEEYNIKAEVVFK